MQDDDRLLPVELIHQIFDYLSTIDILQSFSNLNYYFEDILSNYNRYHVDFQSCLKRNFHRIYSRLQSNQILSLILSNKDDTPNQFQLIFSQWNIEELSHLRAITFIAIENDLLFKFIDTFNNENLQSLTIIPGYYSQKKLPKDSLKKFLVQRLERLDVYNASCIDTSSRYYLKYLTVHDCEIIELQEILSSMPILQSLQVTNHTGGQWLTMNKVPIQLKRLALNLDIRMSLTDIEELLIKLVNLKHLELQIKGNLDDLCNGEQWSIITKQLITFDFDFKSDVDIRTSPQILIDSFCFEEKQWFVAYDTHPSHIFTVPRFASTHAYYSKHSSFSIPAYSTISFDQTLFYDHINHLTILNEFILSQRFIHVKILSIKNLKLINRLQFIVDLNQIQCLKLIDTITTHDLEQLISNKFPRINELHLCTLSKSYHRQLNGIKQILTLYIHTVNNSSQLCRQFPCIERLYIEHVKSYRQIRYILHHLKSHLSYLSLSWSFGHQSKRSFQLTRNLIQRNQQEFNSIYRYHNQHRSTLHLWIDSSTEQVRLSNTAITNVFSQWLFNGLSCLSRY